MTSNQSGHDLILENLVKRYENEGYEVILEPKPSAMPFNLGGYCPDLIARKEGENLIIEVKTQAERISFDRMRTIAEEVRRHGGWQFLLVTSQDIDDTRLPGQARETFSWEEVSRALADAEPLASNTPVLAFMRLWVVFEKMMRFRARKIALPIDRLASLPIMIAQLYSHGELSALQFETAKNLVRVRNQVFHGLDLPDLREQLRYLDTLVRDVREEWSRDENV